MGLEPTLYQDLASLLYYFPGTTLPGDHCSQGRGQESSLNLPPREVEEGWRPGANLQGGVVLSGTRPSKNIYIHTCAHSPKAEGNVAKEKGAGPR